MKWTIILLPLILIGCNNFKAKSIVDEKAHTDQVDIMHVDHDGINDGQAQLQNCKFEDFIADLKTPKLAKEIYLYNDWNLDNENDALALLDSLTAQNKASRPFYLKVVIKTYSKSDGYFSEALGDVAKTYTEQHTKEFIAAFDNEDCFMENDLKTLANIMALEFAVGGEAGEEKHAVDDYINKLKSNCNECTHKQKNNLDTFVSELKTNFGQ